MAEEFLSRNRGTSPQLESEDALAPAALQEPLRNDATTEEIDPRAVDDPQALLASVRLSLVSGVGPRICQLLLERFSNPEGIFAASPSDLQQVQGVGPKLARAITRSETGAAEQLIDECQQQGVWILTHDSPRYPRLLLELPDPPQILYVRGTILPEDALAVAVVGARHATSYGKQQADRLSRGLARAGLTVVSGLARGIDGVAHQAALESGGRTIGVLGSGVLNIYPPEHKALADQIAEQGAVISEAPPHSPPTSGAFPQRNRIITGMSIGVLIVEASLRSGALISARHASEQGRDVFAVPGRVDSRASHGCHRLLREGACLVESTDDILDALGPLVEPVSDGQGREVAHPAELKLNPQEQQVLKAIDSDPTKIDDVIRRSGLPVQRVLATITVLESRSLVRRTSGTLVQRR